jgi:5-methylcytosine-specific restriction endonuclease McrA
MRLDREAKWGQPKLSRRERRARNRKRRAERKANRDTGGGGKAKVPQCPPPLAKRPDYCEYLASVRWRKVREWVFHLAGYRCERCPSAEGLQVHHKTYVRLGREKQKDLEVLCRDCHRRVHDDDLKNADHLRAIQRQF